MASSHLRCCDDFFFARSRICVGDIFSDGPVEQDWILRHHRNILSYTILCDRSDILIIDADFSSLDVEESE